MSTYMPAQGSERRARAIATIDRLKHERMTDPALGRLLDQLEAGTAALPPDDDTAALVRVTRREFDRAARIPARLVERKSALSSALYSAWAEARPQNDFAQVAPLLERMIDLVREQSACFPGSAHVADPLIDELDPGMTVVQIRALFGSLREQLAPIVQAIAAQPPADASALHGHFSEAAQEAFGLSVIRDFGYDFTRGRQDRTHHPFETRFGAGDVRITTRFRPDDLGDALFSTMHEAGHALYEQGVRADYDSTPLGRGASSGVHESQSRTWENLVGRSLPFWQHYYPRLQVAFPGAFEAVPLPVFYRAVNAVSPSLIRVDADEVTYNLHVMIRFDLENALLEGTLAVRDLPEAWHARYQADLGVRAPDDRDGVLQDVHWYGGLFGTFQSYTLGNLMSAQFFDAALAAQPGIAEEMAHGRFDSLLAWQREHIHQHGRAFTAEMLLQRATGHGLSIGPWLAYIRRKYGALYTLPAPA